MKKPYRQALEKSFTRELSVLDSQFKPIPVKAMCKYAGETVYEKKVSQGQVYITLIPEPKGREEFGIEIGWNRKPGFPDLSMRPNVIFPNEAGIFEMDSVLLRLNTFTNGTSFGWSFRGVESKFQAKYFAHPEMLKTTPKEIIEADFKHEPDEAEIAVTLQPALQKALACLKDFGLPFLKRFEEQRA